MLADIKGPI